MHVHVEGGTDAGRKRPFERDVPFSWLCGCPNPEGRSTRNKKNPGYLRRCPDCNLERPDLRS